MTAVAVRASVELLRFPVETERATATLNALQSAAEPSGICLKPTRTFAGGADWLVVWGPGGPDRFGPMRAQLKAGGHVVALDLAYWHRDRKFRVSIDAAHPQRWVMRRPLSADRLKADRIATTENWNPDGPVVVAGIGEKATVQYGPVVGAFEAEMIAAARASGRRVLYRAKKNGPIPNGVQSTGAEPIETVIRGASAVVTWHSNVAVDAIRMGIPVICRDGAAAAVCGSTWTNDLRPLPAVWRDRFLANLAWFQWAPSEATAMWSFLAEALS